MKIRDYMLREVFASRAANHDALLIYDPARRYPIFRSWRLGGAIFGV